MTVVSHDKVQSAGISADGVADSCHVLCMSQADWLKDVLMNDKAHIYVCGDSQMSAGVSAAIGQMIGAIGWLQRTLAADRITASSRSQKSVYLLYTVC